MGYKLFNYQKKAVNELLESSTTILEKKNKNNQYILLEAITGAGKTVISTSYIERISDKCDNICFIWLTLGTGGLDTQSYNRFKKDLPNDISVISKNEILTKEKLSHKDVLVLNWESINNKSNGEFTNILMRDNGEGRNLLEIIKSTKLCDTSIILFIDEAHSNSETEISREIIESVINPMFTIMITATPDKKRIGRDVSNRKAIYIQIDPEDVIEEGVIKKSIKVNSSKQVSNEIEEIEFLLKNALDMHGVLYDKYKQEVNPLILIQIPNGKEGVETRQIVETYLSNIPGFNMDKEYAVKLSNDSDNLNDIAYLKNPIKCLLFKQSLSTGWDCPRAQILVKLRSSKSNTFNLQVVGRILRMPELSRRKHYEDDILNHAYIYTNIKNFQTEAGLYSNKILPVRTEIRSKFKNDLINLMASRVKKEYDNNDDKFNDKFINKICSNYNIIDLFDNNDITIEHVMSDVDSKDIILLKEEISKNKKVLINTLSIVGIEREYNSFIDSIDSKNRNYIKNAIKMLFYNSEELKYKEFSIVDIQKSVLNNKEIFKNIITETLKELKVEINFKEHKYTYTPSSDMYFNKDTILDDKYKKNLYYLVPVTKHKTEMLFQDKIDNDPRVKYWIKNKDRGSNAFSITYKFEDKLYNFYPDYIVKFNDGTLGIYEVKSTSDRDANTTTKDKENSLLKYALNNRDNIKDVQIVKVDSSNEVFITETLGELK